MPSSAGKGWGRHWGAFKLLYYHYNTTKIDRVEQPRTVCGAEECRGVPSSAGKRWGRHCREGVGQNWGAFKLLYYHCNTTKIDGLWCRGVPRIGKGWGRHWGAFKLLYYHCNTTKIDGLWCRGVPRSAEECQECRGVPSSAGKGWGRHWGAFKLLYYHCNTTKIDGLWCRRVPRSAE